MTTQASNRIPVRERMTAIRNSWSAEERTRRAREGQRRQRELISILTARLEPEIWAVGAPVAEDSQRIAG